MTPRARNPFKPTAGATPPLLVGRGGELEAFAEAIEDGPGAPGLLTLITGARGVGKTVMLTELGDVARRRGWVVVDETATPGVRERIAAAVDEHRREPGRPERSRVSSATIPGMGSVTRDLPPRPERGWRGRVTDLLDVLEPRNAGLVITIDEIHAVDRSELTQLAADIQHLVREDRAVSLVLAGLPRAVDDLLNHDVSTFLRRAERIRLEDVDIREVRDSLDTTFRDTGRRATPEGLDRAAAATGGYPFMIQLVGYQVWRRADDGFIDDEAVAAGVDAARVRLGALVHETSLADLSDIDRTFLVAMAADDGPSRMVDLAARMNRDKNYTAVYRERLLSAGIIKAAGHGRVDFALPHLRSYLREHAAVRHEVPPQ